LVKTPDKCWQWSGGKQRASQLLQSLQKIHRFNGKGANSAVKFALQDVPDFNFATNYAITLTDAGLTESAYSVETLFGAGHANGPERSGEAFPEYKPFENLNPYAIYVLKLNSK
jgi:hypothetical protein